MVGAFVRERVVRDVVEDVALVVAVVFGRERVVRDFEVVDLLDEDAFAAPSLAVEPRLSTDDRAFALVVAALPDLAAVFPVELVFVSVVDEGAEASAAPAAFDVFLRRFLGFSRCVGSCRSFAGLTGCFSAQSVS